MKETLTCAFGHTFTRTVTRGRKPELCPEHKAAEDGALAENARRQRADAAAQRSHVKDAALEILTGEVGIAPEFERKLSYVVEHADDPDAAARGLLSRQDQLINEYNRQHARQLDIIATGE